jgi:uncharacterized protein YbjT (DUF2867 family)
METTRLNVLMLGGTGFIGRHAAAALRSRGHRVLIGTRNPRRALAKLPPALRDLDMRETHLESLTTHYVWKPLLGGVDVVVNCVGILRERGSETYDRVQNMAPTALGAACAKAGVRLIHLSVLGLRPEARSPYLRSKLAAEKAIAASGANYSILRPSLVDGDGGFVARWLRRVARWPVHFCPADAKGQMAPLDVRDLGEAIAALCERDGEGWREVDLGGSARRTLMEYLGALRAVHDDRAALRIPVPAFLARLGSQACDLLHFSPFSYGHLELLRRDNAPKVNLLPALLGRMPTPVGVSRPEFEPASGLTQLLQ